MNSLEEDKKKAFNSSEFLVFNKQNEFKDFYIEESSEEEVLSVSSDTSSKKEGDKILNIEQQ